MEGKVGVVRFAIVFIIGLIVSRMYIIFVYGGFQFGASTPPRLFSPVGVLEEAKKYISKDDFKGELSLPVPETQLPLYCFIGISGLCLFARKAFLNKNGGKLYMFNMQRIGTKISHIRKEKNMTQMELADRLGISFQAVSNWERGNSMPDISKLPELAEVLEVSIDELLGEKSVIVEAAINNRIEDVIANEIVTINEISEALPVLKPNQVGVIINQVGKSYSETLEKFLPYLSADDIRELAIEAYKKGESIEIFLPFMCEGDVRDLAFDAYKKGESIEIFLPFMCTDSIRDLAFDAYEKGESIEIFLPFMCEDDVKKLALMALNKLN